MTRDLYQCLTSNSAAYLSAALASLEHDSSDRFSGGKGVDLRAVRTAVEWLASENEKRTRVFTRSDAAFKKHEVVLDERFVDAAKDLLERYEEASGFCDSSEWLKHMVFPLVPNIKGHKAPSDKAFGKKEGSLEHCLAWSDYNRQRMAQHHFTLNVCELLTLESSGLDYVRPYVANAKKWVWRQTERLEATRRELILLEGDPMKIQALREEILSDVGRENFNIAHYYSHLGNGNLGNGDADRRLRSEALQHVQVRLQAPVQDESRVAYSDLGLG